MVNTTLTDAELARLEALAQARANAWPDATVLGSIHHSMSWFMSSVSSLVAEVRALRRHNQAMRGGNKFVRDSLENENAALRERVEALEKMVDWLASALAWGAGKDKKPILDHLPWCDSREKWKEAAREAIK